jgi:hypothetical protein
MKSVFSTCQSFSLCFFVICTFWSCSSYLVVNGNKVPKKVTILVTSYDAGNGNLTLFLDSLHSADPLTAWPGQKIKWKLTDPRHHAIDTLTAKAISKYATDAIFSTPPEKKFWSKSWKAIIKNDPEIKALAGMDSVVNYDYKIVWDTAGIQHVFDPRIQIRF